MSRDFSGGGWSEGAFAPDDTPSQRSPNEDRYSVTDVAGAGGMGVVDVAVDRHLGREVALKRIAPHLSREGASAQFGREARVTACLEHPGIVPLYDVGMDRNDEPYYTMRLIRGRSLSELLAQDSTPARRLPLLKHFLDSCNAMAYAHSKGVVHRDLKPANIMVGEFGETQIVDWGMAVFVDEDEGASPGVGTPAYMSPEQAEGKPSDFGTDVWSLGCILYEFVVGAKLWQGESREQIRSALLGGEVNIDALQRGEVSKELAAICERALAIDPALRYSSAKALAEDIGKFMAGSRVAAHDYSAADLLKRFVRAWWLPLTIFALAMTAIIVVLVVSNLSVDAARKKVVRSERNTSNALADSQQSLQWALASQARADSRNELVPESEVLAAAALQIGDSPQARGVIVSSYSRPRPVLASNTELQGCERVVLGPAKLALCLNTDQVVLWETEPTRQRWSQTGGASHVAFGEDFIAMGTKGAKVQLLSKADGSRRELATEDLHVGLAAEAGSNRLVVHARSQLLEVIDMESGRRSHVLRPCLTNSIDAFAIDRGLLLVACRDARILLIDLDQEKGPIEIQSPFGLKLKPVFAAVLARDDKLAALVGIGGELVTLDLETNTLSSPVALADGPISQLDLHGSVLVALRDQSSPVLWDLEQGRRLLSLPQHLEFLRFAEDGSVRGVSGKRVYRWLLPTERRPHIFPSEAGLSSSDMSPNGELVAAARGDGKIDIWRRSNGALVTQLEVSSEVVKRVVFSPDGSDLAVALASSGGDDLLVFRTDTWMPKLMTGPQHSLRRVHYLPDSTLIGLTYKHKLVVWKDDRWLREVPVDAADAYAPKGVQELLLLTPSGEVVAFDGAKSAELFTEKGATAIASTAEGETIALAFAKGVGLYTRMGVRLDWFPSPSGVILDLALSGDGTRIAVSTDLGDTHLLRRKDKRLLATLSGHKGRVPFVAFVGRDELLTAGWDGQSRLWKLGSLLRSAASIAEDTRRTWAMTSEEALRSPR